MINFRATSKTWAPENLDLKNIDCEKQLSEICYQLKGNPNFQDILNRILQILHYYCRKQHKNTKNPWIIEQNLANSLFSLISVYGRNFSFLEQSTSRILKELRNGIMRNIYVWSLFRLIRLYIGLHFLRFLLEN